MLHFNHIHAYILKDFSEFTKYFFYLRKNFKVCHISYKRAHSPKTDDDCFSTLVSILVIKHDNTLRPDKNIPHICSYQTIIPQTEAVKYLRLHFDCRSNWKEHITRKRKQIDLKTKEINWLIGKNSHLSIENKLLIYKAVIKRI